MKNRVSSKPINHWLDEGLEGQDSLFTELTPELYVADGVISRIISEVAHQYQGIEEKPIAVFLPMDGQVSWHLGLLCPLCSTYVGLDQKDDIALRASRYFGADIFLDYPLLSLAEFVNLWLDTNTSWNSAEEFISSIKSSINYLTDDATSMFLLSTEGEEDELQINFHNSTKLSLSQLVSQISFLFSVEIKIYNLCFKEISTQPNFLVSSFISRHKRFFGRNARDLCLKRIYEADFYERFVPQVDKLSWVSVVQIKV